MDAVPSVSEVGVAVDSVLQRLGSDHIRRECGVVAERGVDVCVVGGAFQERR